MTDDETTAGSESRPAVGVPVERQVRPHSGDWMLPQEAERLAALWCAGQPLDDLPQWRTAMQVLVRELANARAGLKAANDQAERFERGWYLRGDAIEAAIPAMREYARKNPRWQDGEEWQDPCGAHAWLDEFAA